MKDTPMTNDDVTRKNRERLLETAEELMASNDPQTRMMGRMSRDALAPFQEWIDTELLSGHSKEDLAMITEATMTLLQGAVGSLLFQVKREMRPLFIATVFGELRSRLETFDEEEDAIKVQMGEH